MTEPISLTPGVVVGAVLAVDDKKPIQWPVHVKDFPISNWDTGVFITELLNLNKLPTKIQNLTHEDKAELRKNPETLLERAQETAPAPLEEGTYRGTQLALTKFYDLIEKTYRSYMDIANFEPSLPSPLSIAKKRQYFQFTDPATDGLPPHLNLGTDSKSDSNPTKTWSDENPGKLQRTDIDLPGLFNKLRLAQLPSLIPALIPKSFIKKALVDAGELAAEVVLGGMGRPDQGQKIADVEAYNKRLRSRTGFFARNDVYDLPNIADLPDWWSDARFAQQQFTGTNPTTIERATDFWVDHFVNAATDSQPDQAMKTKIQQIASTDKASLYMQDYSYFRKYAGMNDSDPIQCEYDDGLGEGTEKPFRYGTASVCLFHLPKEGQLQPLAIVIDWRGNAKDSVTIYNKELTRSEQKVDWPWRYAKTCVQSADWVRHEMSVHLTLTHMIEEATIVGAQRAFEDSHPVFQLLYPHWQKTLSLNAAARTTLVPYVIIELVGFTADQSKKFLYEEYKNFDFQGRYVPEDLKSRGFDPAERNKPKYINYTYARCIYSMWNIIRSFVKEMLSIHYVQGDINPDQAVTSDPYIKDWCSIMQADTNLVNGGANLKSFPTITTFEGLIDAVTMCIHLASPQHTAVNYLQNYYQGFVINRPPSLYQKLPNTRAELDAYDEKALVEALPMNHPREWLLSSHIPYLLSFKPGDKESLIIYAASKYHVYKAKTDPDDIRVKEAAARFYGALAQTQQEFEGYSLDTWDSADIRYDVLSPEWNAVSILI